MPTVEQRQRYRSDLGVSWGSLPALIVLSLVAAMVLAVILKVLYDNGWYLVVLVPIFGGMALGGILYLLVGWAHCRNYWLAGIVGVVAGLVGYLGYYELCLLEILPPGAGWHVDLLPTYIEARMQTDVVKEVGKPDAAQADKKPSEGHNWFSFVFELVAVTGAASCIAWSRARRAYCPELKRWMQREKALLDLESSQKLRTALDTGDLEAFVAETQLMTDEQTAWKFILEYAVPAEDPSLAYPVYASLEMPSGKGSGSSWFGKTRRAAFRQVALDTAEVLTLRPLFPKLTYLLSKQHEELRDPVLDVSLAPGIETTATDLAQITPVPEPYRQQVRSKNYALLINLVGLTMGIYFFGGIGLIAGGIWLAVQKGMPLGWAAVPVGVLGFAWGTYQAYYCVSVAENRWANRRLRRAISQRPDATVDPRDPESRYVSLIPRDSFIKIKWTMSSDLLLLKIDRRSRQVILEGDSDRYRIPAGSIALCEPERFFHPMDKQHQNEIWTVRLMVNAEEGVRELLLSVNHVRWTPITNAGRRQAAESLCQEINQLRV